MTITSQQFNKKLTTKDDLVKLEKKLEKKLASKKDLEKFATKKDLTKLEEKMDQKFDAAFEMFVTKEESMAAKNEILTAIDGITK